MCISDMPQKIVVRYKDNKNDNIYLICFIFHIILLILYIKSPQFAMAQGSAASVLPFPTFGKEFPSWKEFEKESRKDGKEYGKEFWGGVWKEYIFQ